MFRPDKLGQAHAECQNNVRSYLTGEGLTAIVHNTGSRQWERQAYRDIASSVGAEYTEIYVNSGLSDEELAARNIHNVPVEVIRKMRARWEL